MTRTPWRLVGKHLREHWLRTGLTVAAMTVALFLFCFLVSIVTTVNAAVNQAASNRIIVQSAVSLFVDLPLDYQQKISSVPGVEMVSKFQWFGGYFKDQRNFFAQFAVDHDVFFDEYRRDMRIVEGPGGVRGDAAREAVIRAVAADRRAAVIGTGLVKRFGWKIGDTVPLTGTIFQKTDHGAWDFNIVGIYQHLRSNVDDNTMWIRFDYLKETLEAGLATGPRGTGTYTVNVAHGADPARVSDAIDALFANGPQVTMTSSEAAFQASFVSMLGNLPRFLGTIGGAVVFAVFFSVVNTMMMAGRQRLRETGILKALGFRDGTLALLMVVESLAITVTGGLLGGGFILLAAPSVRAGLGSFVPDFDVMPQTVFWGLGIAVVIGLIAGIGPAWMAMRLRPTEALRSEG